MKARMRAASRQFVAAWSVLILSSTLPLSAALATEAAPGEAALNARAMSLQNRIFGKAQGNQTLSERLEALEKYLLGKVQAGSPQDRLSALEQMLNGKARSPAEHGDSLPPVNRDFFDVGKAAQPQASSQAKEPDAAEASDEAKPISKPFTPDAADALDESKPMPKPFTPDAADFGDEPTPMPKPFTPEAADSEDEVRPAAKVSVPEVISKKEHPGPAPKPSVPGAARSASVNLDRSGFNNALAKIEERIFGHSEEGFTAESRLEHLETFALGKLQRGALEPRLRRVEAVLNGADPGESAAADQSPTNGSSASGNEQQGGQQAAQPSVPSAVPSAVRSAVTPSASPPHVLHGRVDTLASTYTLAGITLQSNTLPTPVTVKLGSRAFKAGVMDNDKLLHAELGIDTLSLVLQRNGHKFALEVPLTDNGIATKLQSNDVRLTSGTSATKTAPITIRGTAAQDWKVLKQYNIAVLLDVSGSMGGGAPSIGMSKNQWCRQEISSFAAEAEKLGSGTFDFCTFTNDFTLTPNCSASQAVAQLEMNPPHGGTNISAPLQAAIDTRYTKSANKPFLIVVITDGLPGGGEPLDSLIVRASQNARSAGDIKIIFLQIGPGRGQILADFLDTQLLSEGARYDIVSSIEWDQLSQIGLRTGLIAALSKPTGSEVVTDPQKQMAFDQMKALLSASQQRFQDRSNMMQQQQMMRNMRMNPGGIVNY